MKPLLSCFSILLLTLVLSSNTSADLAKPKASPQKEPRFVLTTGLEISVDPKGSEARLQIQESDLKELRAALDGVPPNTTIATTISRSPGRTIVAGVLLFLSLSITGVWFARSKRSGSAIGRSQKTVMITLLGLAVVSAAAIITRGNAGPPPYYRWRNLTENLAKGQSTTGGVSVEIVPDDPNNRARMKLIMPLRKQSGSTGDE